MIHLLVDIMLVLKFQLRYFCTLTLFLDLFLIFLILKFINNTCQNGKFRVVLEDLGSKYGTYINEGIEQSKEVPKKTAINLEVGDVIRFGQQWNTWRYVSILSLKFFVHTFMLIKLFMFEIICTG